MRNRTSVSIALGIILLAASAAWAQQSESVPTALRFDGVDDYVDLGLSPSFGAHTIEAWVRLSASPVSDNRNIVGPQGADVNGCFTGANLNLVGGLGGQRFSYNVGRPGCGNDSAITSDPVTAGVWHHLAGTWDGSAMRFYLDGNLVGTQSVSVYGPFDRMLIGAYWDHYSETPVGFFPGDVDEIRLWNRARTQAEIRESSCLILSGSETDLIGYWRLDEGVGQTVFDASPTTADGTLGSNPDLPDSADPSWVASEVHPCAEAIGPIISGVTASPNPTAINAGTTLTANVDESTTGGSDIFSAEYNIDGGSFMPMAAVIPPFDQVSENVIASVAPFSATGLHTLCVRGTDAPGNVGASQCIVLVVYDPMGRFATGGGAVNSPAGADLANTSAAGTATFGFVSKYWPGGITPDGSLEFQFNAGNLNFKSTSMDWLVVTGEPRAIFRGSGTINGAAVCKFQVDAWDGSFSSSELDAFGLRIFSCAGGGDRYSLAARPLKQGSIIIHK